MHSRHTFRLILLSQQVQRNPTCFSSIAIKKKRQRLCLCECVGGGVMDRTGGSSFESWPTTANPSSSTETASTVDQHLIPNMYDLWNRELVTMKQHLNRQVGETQHQWQAAVTGLFGGSPKNDNKPSASPSHSLVSPERKHPTPMAHNVSKHNTPPGASHQHGASGGMWKRSVHHNNESLVASPSIRSHATSKSKESDKTVPLSNLAKHVRARREQDLTGFNTIEEDEDSSATETFFDSASCVPTVVGQDSTEIPTVRGTIVQRVPHFSPENQQHPVRKPPGRHDSLQYSSSCSGSDEQHKPDPATPTTTASFPAFSPEKPMQTHVVVQARGVVPSKAPARCYSSQPTPLQTTRQPPQKSIQPIVTQQPPFSVQPDVSPHQPKRVPLSPSLAPTDNDAGRNKNATMQPSPSITPPEPPKRVPLSPSFAPELGTRNKTETMQAPQSVAPPEPPKRVPLSPSFAPTELDTRNTTSAIQPPPFIAEPPRRVPLSPSFAPNELDITVRNKIASLREALNYHEPRPEPSPQSTTTPVRLFDETAERRHTTRGKSPRATPGDVQQQESRPVVRKPDAPSQQLPTTTISVRRSPKPKPVPRKEQSEKTDNEVQRRFVSSDQKPRNEKERPSPSKQQKNRNSPYSLVGTSCSASTLQPQKDGSPPNTILKSALTSSPISNITTDVRLMTHHRHHRHFEEKKQPDDNDDDHTKPAAPMNHRRHTTPLRRPAPTAAASTMRLVHNIPIADPYGDRGIYTGVVVRHRPESHGTMHYDDGRMYTGGWKRGRWHGHGKAIFTNGDSYTGEYESDVRNGIGRYEWADGRVFDGQFIKDQREGSGTYSWPDGSVYVGQFAKGLRHGSGTFTFADGSVYSGEWGEGKQHGRGECVWRDGRCYRGEWMQGQAHGYGVEVRLDGKIRHEGQWKHDRPIRSSADKR